MDLNRKLVVFLESLMGLLMPLLSFVLTWAKILIGFDNFSGWLLGNNLLM